MRTNLILVTADQHRAAAMTAICASDDLTISVVPTGSAIDAAQCDVLLADSALLPLVGPALVPVLAICGSGDDAAHARANGATDMVMLPLDAATIKTRLRALTRLAMLRGETGQTATTNPARLLGIGVDAALVDAYGAEGSMAVPFDGAALVHAAQGHFDCILIGCAQPQQGEALLRQIRTLDRVRTTPTLVMADAGQGPQASRLLAAGAVDRIDGTASQAEFGLRLAAMGERKALLDALRARNLTHQTLNGMDAATGLQGVDFLRKALATTAARMTAQGKPFSLMVIGIDWHPDLIDSQSMPESIMRPVADVLRRSLRGFDLACRIGGDSFAILMPGADASGAHNAASRLCSEIGAEKVRVTDKRKDGITASIGVATLAANGAAQGADALFDTACAALQAARAEGAAQVRLVQSAA